MKRTSGSRVAVVMGGVSAEREVSLGTGCCVVNHLTPHLSVRPINIEVDGRWQAQARSNLRDEIYRLRRQLSLSLIKQRSKRDPREIVDRWLKSHADEVARYKRTLHEMKLRDEVDFATLSVAAQELKDLISS